MPVNTVSDAKPGPARRDFLVVLVCLLAVLGVLFHRSFKPEDVLFSNDGPLGAVKAQADHPWKNLLGSWQDLNWLGGKQLGTFLSIGYLFYGVLGPLLYSKFIAPVSLLLLGLSAWLLFRQLGFHRIACVLGGLAAALNTDAFSVSCWGVPAWTLSQAGIFLALAALPKAGVRQVWIRAALSGLAVGLALVEGFDVGAIFSLYIAAYVFFQALLTEGPVARRIATGLIRVALVAVCAALTAAQALVTLVGTQVKGVAGMEQDVQTRQMRWEEATQWSLPKAEALRIIIPGIFGYRIPDLYGEQPQSANGSNYWGAVGRGPGMFRHSGNGEFAGVLVGLLAAWALVQSFRKKYNPFADAERKCLWFWGGAALVSLLLAFGKYTPFYQFVYALPYFSIIRNPIKFLHPFHVALVILFAYGLHGLSRGYLLVNGNKAQSVIDRVKSWWKVAPAFDKKWTLGCVVAIFAALLGWLVYASSKNELIRYLQQVGFPDEPLAASIARFSLGEAGQFVFFFLLSIAALTLVSAGAFSGRRSNWGGICLGLLLVIDLVRADVPWIVYYNYRDKYASNPIIDLLREKSYQHRVAGELAPSTRSYLVNEQGRNFAALYGYEWLQHLFQYYHIQSLDIIQMPRMPEFDKAYMLAFRPTTNDNRLSLCGRLWQLTNTRYVLGMTGFLQLLNTQVDPVHQRFRVQTTFDVVPKPGIAQVARPEHLTAVPVPNGPFALFEFTGALPRAGLFNQWEVISDNSAALARLASGEFDPARTVVLDSPPRGAAPSTATNQTPGTIEIARYEPKLVRLMADAAESCVLLLNDHYDPDWKVFVDGAPEPLLRCNYIMRGVHLTPGKHVVEFRFQPPLTAFYVSLSSLAAGVFLCGFLVLSAKRERNVPELTSAKGNRPPTTNVRKSK